LRRWLGVVVLLVLAGCGNPPGTAPAGTSGASERAARPAAPQRITAAIRGEARNLVVVASLPGGQEVRDLLWSGLGVVDDRGEIRPQLAAVVPSLENGLWRLFPDGTMETTWHIRPEVRWHDGAPLTAEDLVFTVQVGRDPELAVLGHVGFALLEGVTPSDERTAMVRWKQPYILADTLFSSLFAAPLPRHLLLPIYNEDKASLPDAPYWSEDFVSSGPFKLREWARGSHLELVANEAYAPGRPKLDQIRITFIPDPNVLVASVLSNAVDVTLGRSLSLDQALQVRNQWRNGRIEIGFQGRIAIVPQFVNAVPPVITNVQFRRALLHATDRQAMADVLQDGLSAVADSYLNPNQSEYRQVEAAIPRYPYDPRLAAQMLESFSYARGPEGGLRDAAGQRLVVELRTSQGDDLQEKALFSTADNWQRAGVGIDSVIVPSQRQQDREYRANHPGFELYRQPDDLPFLGDLHGSQAPLPENNYAGRNRSRYVNPEFDALLDRYFVTIPRAERIRVVGQIISHISDQLTIMGLFYNTNPAVRSNRLTNASAVQRARVTWNAHEWAMTQ
jgi:peptide/nickel transport system substrate-binding protein